MSAGMNTKRQDVKHAQYLHLLGLFDLRAIISRLTDCSVSIRTIFCFLRSCKISLDLVSHSLDLSHLVLSQGLEFLHDWFDISTFCQECKLFVNREFAEMLPDLTVLSMG